MRNWTIFLTVIALAFQSQIALSQTLTEVQPLSFGKIALTSNNAIYRYSIGQNSNIIYKDPQFAILEYGSAAEFQFEGFLANTMLLISITAPTNTTKEGTNCCLSPTQMTISDFDYPTTLFTDPNGSAYLRVGASLRTSGTQTYIDNIYFVSFNVTIDYP